MKATPQIKKYFSSIGSIGGKAKTPAKLAASRANGAKGGRPKKESSK